MMKTKVILLITLGMFLFLGCTPSLDLLVDYSNLETKESDHQIHFEFKRFTKSGSKNLDLTRVWIYKDDSLVIDMEKVEYVEGIQYMWDFPSIPKGFEITYPKNTDTMPSFGKNDTLRFDFLAGGGYNSWEYNSKP